jgi:hypothetical protein
MNTLDAAHISKQKTWRTACTCVMHAGGKSLQMSTLHVYQQCTGAEAGSGGCLHACTVQVMVIITIITPCRAKTCRSKN